MHAKTAFWFGMLLSIAGAAVIATEPGSAMAHVLGLSAVLVGGTLAVRNHRS